MPLTLPTVETTRIANYALSHFAPMPAEHGLMWADGISPLRHFIGATLGTGLLAPSATPTATPTGAKASTRLDTDDGGAYVIADGDNFFIIYNAVAGVIGKVFFRTALSAIPGANEVVIGGSTSQALTNLKAFINQTGVEGVDYFTYHDFSGQLLATTLTSTDLTIEATEYGTAANAYVCTWVGGAGPRFEVAGSNTSQVVFSGGSAGTGTTPGGGVFQYAYAYVREDDGAVSGLSPLVEANNGGGRIDIAGMTASADASVDYNRIYRTTVGGGLFYRVDEVAAATTTYQDSTADSTITAFNASAYDERLTRSYRAGMPPKGRYLARFQGRWFTGGALLSATYAIGTATVNSLATAVTITTGIPRTAWVGRTIQFTTSETYTIMSVSESASTLEIDRPLEGGANLTTVAYTVKDLRDPYELFWSEPGLPNNWPVQNSLKGVTSPDGRGITGIYAAYESLIVFTRQNVWRVIGSEGLYQAHLISDKCGCVSGHTVVMDGGRMYWLGADGVYGWTGSGEPENLNTPSQQDVALRGQDDTIGRLTLGSAHRAVAVNDQDAGEIRFYVPMDGERTNRYAIVLDLQNGGFALDTCEDVTAAWVLQGPTGEDAAFTGDITGALAQQGLSTSDIVYGIEQVQSVTASSVRTATVASTPFSTSSNGYWGAPVWQVSADGTFLRNCVATNTSSVLTYRRFQTAQATSTQMVVGGILLWVQTGRFDFGDRRLQKIVPGITVAHSPQADGQFFFFSAYGQGDFAIPTVGRTAGDLTVGNTANDFGPRRRFRVRKEAVLHGWGLACLEPGVDVGFAGVTIEVRARDELDLA